MNVDSPKGPSEVNSSPYIAIQQSEQFIELRRKFRGFVFPLTAFFLIWYFLYVLLVTFAPSLMSTRVFGTINLGLIFGLLQFVSTFAITMRYVRWADREFDPRAEQIAATMKEGSDL